MPTRMLRIALVIAAVAATSGCAGTAGSAGPTTAPASSAAPAASSPDPTGTPPLTTATAAIATECSLVSVAESTMFNGRQDYEAHRIDAGEYHAVLNTVKPGLLLTPQHLPKAFAAKVDALQRAVGEITVGSEPSVFDPYSAAMRAALTPISTACKANGTELGVLATSGG